jgi:hypothetical protein
LLWLKQVVENVSTGIKEVVVAYFISKKVPVMPMLLPKVVRKEVFLRGSSKAIRVEAPGLIKKPSRASNKTRNNQSYLPGTGLNPNAIGMASWQGRTTSEAPGA